MTDIAEYGSRAIAAGSKSFAAASRLFAPAVRRDAAMLYAWCRRCDDLIDEQNLGFGRVAGASRDAADTLAALRRDTLAALAGRPPAEPAFEALAEVVRRHAIPARHPLELIEGMAMDASGRRYRTVEDTLSYCYHVAGAVGVMMAIVMGERRQETLHRAADLGIAFQLTNIARDVADDARIGRVYLPEEMLEAEGLARGDVGCDRHWPAVARIVARLARLSAPYYASGLAGIRRLPFRSAWAVAAARGIYREIEIEVSRRGADAWSRRVITPRATKLRWVLFGAAQAVGEWYFGGLFAEIPRPPLWTKRRPAEASG